MRANATTPAVGRRRAAFSLIEVIAAVVIFAVGMISVLGLYGPLTKSVAAVSDTDAAARVADAVRARLRLLSFDQAAALVQDTTVVARKDADGAYNPNDGTRYPAVMFGRADGDVGIYDAATNRRAWFTTTGARMLDADKFFEIDLIRNDTLTPKPAADSATGAVPAELHIAYTLRVRWPAFVQTAPGVAVQGGQNTSGGAVPFDHGRKGVIFFSGVISR
jgi:prepilin-type N-terminal cleavage/methylation domain-containing protein